MKIKKLTALILGLILALTSFSSCNNTDAKNTTKGDIEFDSFDDLDSIEEITDTYTEPDSTETSNSGEVYSQTIMIYMVGSDLESQYGSATMDLTEMIKAAPDTTKNNIVIYTGGAADWKNSAISADSNTTLRLVDGDFEVIKTEASKNMGESETLSSFMTYCFNEFETDKYSLILWNHGGGPVFGYGMDELHNDMLNVPELKKAVDTSVKETSKKFEWIGFDACLMSSLEIADALEPYCNYLISSQETEPGFGWNYEFLSALSKPDMNGENLGKEIINSYFKFGEQIFEENPSYYADLTLSCMDLRNYKTVEDEFNKFFESIDHSLTNDSFTQMVRDRNNTKNFGTYSSDYNYSLVDTYELINKFSSSNSVNGDALISALEKMIVYNKTNISNTHGISVCYPYKSEEGYAEYCMGIQNNIGFADNYVSFLKNFYAVENGETISNNWDISNAEASVNTINSSEPEITTVAETEIISETTIKETEAETVAETTAETEAEIKETSAVSVNISETLNAVSSGMDISLKLNDEQRKNFGNAGFYILRKVSDLDFAKDEKRVDEMYMFIHGGKNVKLDDNGVLHAYYSDNVVYMKDNETGKNSPFPMILIDNNSSDKEKRYLTNVVLMNTDDFSSASAELQIVVNDDYPNGIIRSAVPTGSSNSDNKVKAASKQLLDIYDYDLMSVVGRCSYITRDDKGKLLPFFNWENSGILMGFEQSLESKCELEITNIEDPQNYVCMFVVTDSQGNISTSELIPLGK